MAAAGRSARSAQRVHVGPPPAAARARKAAAAAARPRRARGQGRRRPAASGVQAGRDAGTPHGRTAARCGLRTGLVAWRLGCCRLPVQRCCLCVLACCAVPQTAVQGLGVEQ